MRGRRDRRRDRVYRDVRQPGTAALGTGLHVPCRVRTSRITPNPALAIRMEVQLLISQYRFIIQLMWIYDEGKVG